MRAGDLSRNGLHPIDPGPRGFDDPALEGLHERLRAIDRKVRPQRRLIRPLLEEEQPHRILTVDMHVMRDAAGLGPRTLDMLKAGGQYVVESVFAHQNAAGNQNHFGIPTFSVCGSAQMAGAARR